MTSHLPSSSSASSISLSCASDVTTQNMPMKHIARVDFIILMVILSNYMYSLFRNMTVDRFTAVAFSLGAVLLLKFIYGYREVRVKEETENLNNFCEPRRFCDESLSSFLLSTGIFPPKNYVRRNVDAPDGVVPMNFRLIRIKQKAAYMSNR